MRSYHWRRAPPVLKPPGDTPRPEELKPTNDIVSYAVDLALVLLGLEKSGAPLPCDFILGTAAL